MLTTKTLSLILINVLLLGACGFPLTLTPINTPEITPSEPIGIISAVETLVESGPMARFSQVTHTADFFNNYVVRVTNGGVADLNLFKGQISLRFFNDTTIGSVHADPSGTIDNYVRMKLVYGGLSGEVTKNGIPVQFEITNGVNIYVLGTQFLVLYDPETGTTYIGNFDGTIAYKIPGQSVQFTQAGHLYEIPSNFVIKRSPLTFTRTDIDNLTSNSRSRLLDILRGYYINSTATPTPSPTTTPTLSPAATPIPTKIIPCDKAAFITDVTVPDGTVFSPGSQLTKTWRIKNVGTCTWTNGYSLVFYRGEQMSGITSYNFPASVAPGQTADISVGLAAPTLPGTYRGDWMLRNPSAKLFGVGADGMNPVWVIINVISASTVTATSIGTGSITGTVSDMNGNVTQNFIVTLYNSTGKIKLAGAVTGIDGKYTFPNLIPGSYLVGWDIDECGTPTPKTAPVNVIVGKPQPLDIDNSRVVC